VGKTNAHPGEIAVLSVHPHACGENCFSRSALALRDRSTPTRVGKTLSFRKDVTGLPGPPPRVWGKLDRFRDRRPGYRSTPTRVGKTVGVSHPTISDVGPPPRVWGKRIHPSPSSCARRSTPTRVGKTTIIRSIMRASSVHPHACGENVAEDTEYQEEFGPPPRVWGKRNTICHNQREVRSTPTRVGKTIDGEFDAKNLERSTPTRVGKTGRRYGRGGM